MIALVMSIGRSRAPGNPRFRVAGAGTPGGPNQHLPLIWRKETAIMTAEEARKLAHHWVEAWNAHDLEEIMTHYDDAVELTSPVAARLLSRPDGKIKGKADLRAYFQRGL